MTDEFRNNIIAQLGAYHYLVGYLLKYSFRELDEGGVKALSQLLKDQIRKVPDSVTGKFEGNEEGAMHYAEAIVLMHQAVDGIVDEAVEAVLAVLNQRRR